jgi:hypothetical protein
MERSKDIMIQQLNLLVRNRAIDGFAVDSIEPGGWLVVGWLVGWLVERRAEVGGRHSRYLPVCCS